MKTFLPLFVTCLALAFGARSHAAAIIGGGGGGTTLVTTNGILGAQAAAIARTNALAQAAVVASPRVFFVGDSMLADDGIPGSANFSYSLFEDFPTLAGFAARVNLAQPGNTVAADLANFDTRYRAFLGTNAYSQDIWVIQSQFNDLAGGATASTVTNNLGQLIALIRAGGARRIYGMTCIGTNYAYGSFTAAKQAAVNLGWTNFQTAGVVDGLVQWHLQTPEFFEGGTEVGIHPTGKFSAIAATNAIAGLDWSMGQKRSVASFGEAVFEPARLGNAIRANGNIVIKSGKRISFPNGKRPSAGFRSHPNGTDNVAIYTYEIDRITVHEDGTVSIGLTNDSPYKLDVLGHIHASDITADSGVTGVLRGKSGSAVTNTSVVQALYIEEDATIVLRSGGDTSTRWGRAAPGAAANFATDGSISGNAVTAVNGVTGILRGKSGSVVTNTSVVQAIYVEAEASVIHRHQTTNFTRVGVQDNAWNNVFTSGAATGDYGIATATGDIRLGVKSQTPQWRFTQTGLTFPDGTTQTTAGGGGGGSTAWTNHIALQFGASSSSPTDGQTIFFGNPSISPQTSAASAHRIYVQRPGTITAASLQTAHTSGSGEDWSFYVRVNDTTDYLIQTIQSPTDRAYNDALSVPLAAGDYFHVKAVNPTWATNPANFRPWGSVLIRLTP